MADIEREIGALYLALRDSRTPLHARGVIVLLVAYAVSPIDPLPDFIPVVGYLDELLILPVGLAIATRLVPDAVMTACRERAEERVVDARYRWLGLVIVIVAWMAIGMLVARYLLGWG
ncbi:MAG: YkvA family protein [Halobacteriaceae archaeon]